MFYPRLNGLAPVFIRLMERGWVTHLATNGAGIIHDWEFSFQGKSSEDVRANVLEGNFGIWQETGFTINLALIVRAYAGLGYGESAGSMIENECLNIPDSEALRSGGVAMGLAEGRRASSGQPRLLSEILQNFQPHGRPHAVSVHGQP